MKFEKIYLDNAYIIYLEPKEDERGYFARVFDNNEIPNSFEIVQINKSLTLKKGTIRGLHFQKDPKAEDKIIQCVKGSIFDVIVDIRKSSTTYLKWYGIELKAGEDKMILVPKGFAHGFQTLEDNSCVEYFVSQYYSPKYEEGLRYNDPYLKIEWPIKEVIVSKKDSSWPLLK